MLTRDDVPASDFGAGRLLGRLSQAELAKCAGSSVSAVERLEWGLGVQARTRSRVYNTLVDAGVRFLAPGDVRHVDGRVAPTRKLVGSLHGERVKTARKRLGLSVADVAERSGLSCEAIERLESMRALQEMPCLRVYSVVGVLQLAGYEFRIGTRGGRSGDRLRDDFQGLAAGGL